MNSSVILYWVVAYLMGAIPFGWIITKLVKGIDIRYHASGRMGMSNVMRTAGTGWGLLTAVLDIAKGYAAVKLAAVMVPECPAWVPAVGGVLSVIGHIRSIFLIERRRDGKYYLRGGAGGLTSVGAGLAIWPMGYLLWVGIPCLILYLFLGYASVATAAFNLFAMIGFSVAAAQGKLSWWYVGFCAVSFILVAISLRPNFKRLRRGEERKTSLRIRWRKEDRK